MASYFLTRSLLEKILDKKRNPHHENNGGLKESKFKPFKIETLKEELTCRACLGISCVCVSLRQRLGTTDVISALRSITNMTISTEDEFPQNICLPCLQQLESSYEFQQKCRATQYKFHNTIQSDNHSMDLFPSPPQPQHNFEQILRRMQQNRTTVQKEVVKKPEKIIANTVKIKSKKTIERRGNSKFKCRPCNIGFDSKEEYDRHRCLGACVRRACHICGQLVLGLRQHLRVTHARELPYVCSVCGKRFAILARLKTHQRVHEDTFNFHCAHCPYKCKHKYYLVVHMRTHTGQEPYTCPECGARFKNPSNLNKHRLTHGTMKFTCRQCDRSFRTSGALRVHDEAVHRNVKHACRVCDRLFKYKSDLRTHEIKHHDRKKRDYVGMEPTYRQVERMQNTLHVEYWPNQTMKTAKDEPTIEGNYHPANRDSDPAERASDLHTSWSEVQTLSLAQLLVQPQRQLNCLQNTSDENT